jgi:hypothetical protein
MGLQGSARTASTWAPIFIPSNARLRQADPPWGKNVKEIGVAERKASRKDTSGRHRHGLRRRHSRRGKAAFPQSCLAICHFIILPEYNTRVPVIYDHHDTSRHGARRASPLARREARWMRCVGPPVFLWQTLRSTVLTRHATFCNLTTTPLDHARTTRASHVTNARTWRNPV